jgi:hypothetical protein
MIKLHNSGYLLIEIIGLQDSTAETKVEMHRMGRPRPEQYKLQHIYVVVHFAVVIMRHGYCTVLYITQPPTARSEHLRDTMQ